MSQQPERLGASALKLLTDAHIVAVLRHIASGGGRPSELAEAFPGMARSTLERRLRRLHRHGVVSRTRKAQMPPATLYSLTDGGRRLLEVPVAAERWEADWYDPEQRLGSGLRALRTVADERTYAILLALADHPLRTSELDRTLEHIGRSALMVRLRELVSEGVLERVQDDRGVSYQLSPAARRLGLVPMLAARWEWREARPAEMVRAGNLSELVRLLAPIALVREGLSGVCALHVGSQARGYSLYLLALEGKLLVLGDHDPQNVQAVARHSAEEWCGALAAGERVEAQEGQELMDGVMDALSGALLWWE